MILLRLYAALLVTIGVILIWGGGALASLGGSPYYLVAGLLVTASGALFWQGKRSGVPVFALMFLATVVWAIWEAGLDGWALMARLLAPAVLGLGMLSPWLRRANTPGTSTRRGGLRWLGGLAAAVTVGLLLHNVVPAHTPADPIYQAGTAAAPAGAAGDVRGPDDGDWPVVGSSAAADRFSRLTQITPANVTELAQAWSFKVGRGGATMEVTPIEIGARLYLCAANNDVLALDAETGRQVWRYNAQVDMRPTPLANCRGVAYYRAAGSGPCAERIITNTTDARLIALDASTGRRCAGFGTNGEVSLLSGLGHVEKGYYYPKSAPVVVRDRIILGASIADNQYWGEPSGVIRAYDVFTGKLVWAWDMGRPERRSAPPAGETYTSATPNAWAPLSADAALGLVYVPMGNATPDFFGAQRRPFDEKYGGAIVALDVGTGMVRWSFQTVHHDLWDYDLAAQPTLVDYPVRGGTVRALVQGTKTGEIFVLDRATGAPLRPVAERAVPQTGVVPEERPSRTQPFSFNVPSLRGADLKEQHMWGITPLDQLWCRIRFRQARYSGPYTPPGLSPSIASPGGAGGIQWSGFAVDPERGVAIVNSGTVPFIARLLTRKEVAAWGLARFRFDPKGGPPPLPEHLASPQEGLPYGVEAGTFLSPLMLPCTQPPFSRLVAIDLVGGKLLWSRPLGSAINARVMGLRVGLPFTIGTPTIGGALATRSGLTFIAAAQDDRLRAFDTATGKLLWTGTLPAGGNASPMTYLSPSGRQMVVIAAGGNPLVGSTVGDQIVAYALPRRADR